jgi:hypothetical protein
VKIPNGERADLGEKLEEYMLNPRHSRGRHKARVFASVLGITRDNQEILESALREAASNSTDAISTGDEGFGETFEIRFRLTTDRGQRDGAECLDYSQRRRLSSTDNLFYYLTMPSKIRLHDVVALMEDVPATHFLTHKPLQLRRGQIGTVVMLLEDSRFQVEFSDSDGRAYAMLPLRGGQLMVLREQPEPIPA